MKKEKLNTIIITIVFIALCSYPLFVNLGKLSLRMWDESRNALNAFEMLQNKQYIVTHFEGKPDMWNTKPPLLVWFIAFFMKIFGPTTLALRLPSALSALSTALFCLWLSKKYLSSLIPGIFAGFVLCYSVGFVDYHAARNGDFDAMLSMWVFFYSMLFFIYLETKERKILWLSALCIALAILTKGIAACMFLPGLALFVIINKKYWLLFKKAEFYLIPLTGLLIGASYYFIREMYNPGYLNAVIENEITGRYLNTVEGHKGDILFYLRLMFASHYQFWLWCVPVSCVISFVQKDQKVKLLSAFLLTQSLLYLIIISIADTKLPWYDVPLYPFLGLIIGLALASIYDRIILRFSLKQIYEHIIVFAFLGLIVFYFPVSNMLGTSIKAKKENFYPELFYGDFINSFYKKFPNQISLKIISEDYNPHLLFYKKVFYSKGHYIDVVPPSSTFHINDTIMICEPLIMWPFSKLIPYADTIYREDNKVVLKINDPKIKGDVVPSYERYFYSMTEGIKYNKEWYKKVVAKAEENKFTIQKQTELDAIFNLESTKQITKEEGDRLKEKFNLN